SRGSDPFVVTVSATRARGMRCARATQGERQMNRSELVRRLADAATRPIIADDTAATADAQAMHQPVADAAPPGLATVRPGSELFVWFEDTSTRNSRNGIAGLPESLLPYSKGMKV